MSKPMRRQVTVLGTAEIMDNSEKQILETAGDGMSDIKYRIMT